VIRRIYAIAKKEFRQIFRDIRSLAVLLLLPIFLLVMFGYAISLDVRHIPIAVYDAQNSAESRRLVSEFNHSEYFDLRYRLSDVREIDALLDRGRIRAALVIPRDFSRLMLRDRSCEVQVLLDGSNSTSAQTALGYIEAVIRNYCSGLNDRELLRFAEVQVTAPVDYRPRVWYNPELHSSVFLVPGLVTFIMLISAVISTALSIVREKERGTMEQILVSPIRPAELIVGKTIPYVIISLAVSFGVLAVSHLLFGVAVKGSYPVLFLVILLFLLSCLGMGILISTLTQSQHMAFTLSALLTILPAFILSGFVFPIRNMPVVIQAITYLFPGRFFLVALRSVIIKGTGLASFWKEALALVAFGAVTLTVSILRMKPGPRRRRK
jgi:ABC-2 type transport system permease protein